MADDSLKLANAAYVDEDFDSALRHYTDVRPLRIVGAVTLRCC